MEGRTVFMILIVLFCFSQVLSEFNFEADEDHQVHGTVRGGNRKVKSYSSDDCKGLCGVRCGKHSRPNVCLRACGTCCLRCNCVPPGTHGNHAVCGRCYTEMTTHGNRTKCP